MLIVMVMQMSEKRLFEPGKGVLPVAGVLPPEFLTRSYITDNVFPYSKINTSGLHGES